MINPDFQSNLKKGLSCTCPRCGEGKIFNGFLSLVEICPNCGLKIAAHDNGDGPAVFLIFILGFSLVPLALLVDYLLALPLWVHAVLWSVLGLATTVGCLRPAKAYVMALDYYHRPDLWEKK